MTGWPPSWGLSAGGPHLFVPLTVSDMNNGLLLSRLLKKTTTRNKDSSSFPSCTHLKYLFFQHHSNLNSLSPSWLLIQSFALPTSTPTHAHSPCHQLYTHSLISCRVTSASRPSVCLQVVTLLTPLPTPSCPFTTSSTSSITTSTRLRLQALSNYTKYISNL